MVQTSARAAVIVTTGLEKERMPSRFMGRSEETTLLEYVLDSVWTVADEIYVVFPSEPSLDLVESIASFGVKIAVGRSSNSPLDQMVTGFRAMKCDQGLVVSERIPFLRPSVAFTLFEAAAGYDAAIPRWKDGRIETLPAVYSKKTFLKALSQMGPVDSPEKVVDGLFAVRFVEIESELKPLDPELSSFFTLKSIKDLEAARQYASASV